jgi:hypothetical protein
LTAHSDDKVFWIDQDIGPQLCSLMEAIFSRDPNAFGFDPPLRRDIDALLGSMIRMGVTEAHRLEASLRLI